MTNRILWTGHWYALQPEMERVKVIGEQSTQISRNRNAGQ